VETVEPGWMLAGKWDVAGGVFRFVTAMFSDALPGWAKWTIGGLVAVGSLWEAGKWLRRRRRVGIR
jgi:hypothetical protein